VILCCSTAADALAVFKIVLDAFANARKQAAELAEKLGLEWPLKLKLSVAFPGLSVEAVTESLNALEGTMKMLPEFSDEQARSLRQTLLTRHVVTVDELPLVLTFCSKHFRKYDDVWWMDVGCCGTGFVTQPP
jgi:hypothetical protein